MDSSADIGVSRRGLLMGGAACATVTAFPANASSKEPTAPMETPPTLPVQLKVNGKPADLTVDTRTTLLDALREHLHLTGTKKGCDHG